MEKVRVNVTMLSLIFLVLAGLSASQSPGCSNNCEDYYHLCPAVHDTKFLQNYNEDVKNGLIELPNDMEIPVSVNCSGMFWKLRCPKACGVCVSCGGSSSTDCDLPQPIHVMSVAGEDPASGYSAIESAVDTLVWTPDADCYRSKSTKTGWAHFTIPMSVVTMVSIASLQGNQMYHYKVKVCSGTQHCVECGKMPTSSNRYWVQSDCPVGTKGDRIEIRTDRFTDYLQLCEVEIFGLNIGCANGSATGPEKLAKIESSISSRPNDIDVPIKFAHDGYSHDTSKCYQSRDIQKGWANFKLSSTKQVTKVSVSVKEGTYADEYHIRVCTGNSNCVECSRMTQQANVNPAWGDSSCPQGTRGDTIKIIQDPTANRLQLCEVKVYEIDMAGGATTGVGPMKLLPIIKSKGMAAHSNHMQLTAAYDGIVETADACYVSESSTRGWAEFTIKSSLVTKVSIITYANGVTDDYHVRVCVGRKDCVECSDFPYKNAFQWADATCPEGTQGDTIRIDQDNDVTFLKLCEVKITGTEVQPGAERKAVPKLLPIVDSEGYSYYSGYKDTNGAHDGYIEGEKSCYKSSNTRLGWAKFKLEKVFLVTKVAVAPIDDYDAQYYDVSVCTGDIHCIDCAVMSGSRGDYQFTDSVCPEGTRGDTIHIVQGYQDFLELCEVKVTGLDVEESDANEKGPPYLLKIDSAKAYHKHSGYGNIVLAFDGYNYGGSSYRCYSSSTTTWGYAIFNFPMSQVTKVSIVPYDVNPSYYWSPSICINETNCIECGRFTNMGNYRWTHSSCQKGTYGNSLRIYTDAKKKVYLKLCEVKITGYDGLDGLEDAKGPWRILSILSAQASSPTSSSNAIIDAYAHKGMLADDQETCYKSATSSLAFANFSIPTSEVTMVSMAAATYGYTMHYFLTICNSTGGHCTDCGYFFNTDKFTWSNEHCPEGTRGNLVRVTARYGYRLEICEIKIYGYNVDNSTVARGAPKILNIISSTAADYTHRQIKYAHDGYFHSTDQCYRSYDGNKGWAAFKIRKSEVSKVSISPEKGSDADDYYVKVCTGENDCVECGKMSTVTDLYWTDSVCPPGTIGDTVRINQHPNADKLRLCEVKISGWDAADADIMTPGPARLLEIKDARADAPKTRSYNVDATYDGVLDTGTQCYESKKDYEGWIEYTIEMSEVTKVSLSAKTGSNMNDYYVQVCSSEKDCVDCSYLPAVSDLAWADSICPNGTIGNKIKLTQNPNANNLGICEVKITGYKGVTSPSDGKHPHKRIKIEDAEASDYKYGHEDIEAAYDGVINKKDECYKSDDDNYGYANFKIAKSVVSRVGISAITGSNTDNYRIKVCTGDSNCVFCSNLESTSNYLFVDSECPEGTKGDTIKVTQDYEATGLEVCELKVIGTPL